MMQTIDEGEEEGGRQVLRRCPHCRLLFEAREGCNACVVCGATVDGLALPVCADAVPIEVNERETTAPLAVTSNG
jgi:hypothetical protein